MMKKRLCSVALIFGVGLNQALAGPFGLNMGMPLKSIGDTSTPIPDGFRLTAVPKPYPTFEYYYVTGSDANGLCRIIATTPQFSLSGSGISDLNATFNRIKLWLEKQYGEGVKVMDSEARQNGQTEVLKEYNWEMMSAKNFDQQNIDKISLSTDSLSADSGKTLILTDIQFTCPPAN